ncbi:MBL fold metallo-hydrolase [Alicyclobacillus fastidiosus]|uniref:MBL fold metallo-hydrolase n=1 Tax=Alicyclobacillus fastidiosus TaxID=392011 RepID=A0ABV5AGE1_9BACL|nr:MBL fold metallo-hydrolase [Alicyclobacillus fastidiosus]WEH08943.1 MBL fold metallo-hydrolase [Alicyclobacillus fastidiosus]
MSNVYRQGTPLLREIESTVVPSGAVALWNLGQAGVLIKGAGSGGANVPTIAVDPYLTRSIEVNDPATEFVREYDPPLEPEDLSLVDVVLLTHHHDDHMDLATISQLHRASPSTRFVVPAPHAHLLLACGVREEALVLARADEPIRVGEVDVVPVAAAHTAYETDAAGDHLYLGYVIGVGGVCIYHSGDTVITDDLVQTMRGIRPQIALLPINGGDYARTKRGIVGNMTAREAIDFAVDIGVDLVMPNHYDMFPNNRDNPSHLIDYLFHEHRELKFHMSAVGERFVYFP